MREHNEDVPVAALTWGGKNATAIPHIMLGGMQGMAAEFQWGSEPAKQVAMLGSVATIDVGAAFWPPVASRE